MRSLLAVLLVCSLALIVTFVAVVVGGDSTITVPPPESVAEQFARQIAVRRYDRALQHVDDSSGISLTMVRLGGEALHARGGAVDQVEGEAGSIEGDRSTASALLTTERAGRVRYAFRLVRRSGVWKIVEWEDR
jgi:hypothetical protein